jgi:ethanolamine ammonia-lyase small subunit
LDRARARDAVHQPLDPSSLAIGPPLILESAAPDRATYLRRPDLGRQLDPESAQHLTRGNWDAAIVVADGPSATAVHRQGPPLIDALMPQLGDWCVAPVCLVQQGRVVIGDEIGERLGARFTIVLIGKRPGLSSPGSLGALSDLGAEIRLQRRGTKCVSNIRQGGLKPELAARRIDAIMCAAFSQELTGVHLKMTFCWIERLAS